MSTHPEARQPWMHRIWPRALAGPIDADALERLYDYPADRSWLAVNFVASADGAITVRGRSAGLTNAADREVFALGSDLADVVLLGAGTAVTEEFHGLRPDSRAAQRRRSRGLAPVPPIAVVSTGPRLPADAPVLTDTLVPSLVITPASTPEATRRGWAEAGAEVIMAGQHGVDLPAALAQLHDRGLRRIDCEGGPELFGSLIAARAVDELRLTVSPLLIAGSAQRIAEGEDIEPESLHLDSVLASGDTLLCRYLLSRGGAGGDAGGQRRTRGEY